RIDRWGTAGDPRETWPPAKSLQSQAGDACRAGVAGRIEMSITAKGHELLSRNLLLPLWHMQRYIRPSRRAVASAIRDGLRFRRAAADWSDERKRTWMLQRLRFTVRRAYRDTPYYREVFDAIGFDPSADFSFADFARLPVLER